MTTPEKIKRAAAATAISLALAGVVTAADKEAVSDMSGMEGKSGMGGTSGMGGMPGGQ